MCETARDCARLRETARDWCETGARLCEIRARLRETRARLRETATKKLDYIVILVVRIYSGLVVGSTVVRGCPATVW